jgi:hypothetical protein
MNLFQKTLFAAGVVITLFSLFACSANKATLDAGATIAEFDPPTGYTSEFSTSMLGYSVVAYKGQNAPSHLYLIQSEKESDGDELAKMLAQLVPGSSNADTRMTVIENRQVTVRGQETTLIVSEGVNSENVSYRQISAAFEGKGGPALLLFSESAEAWDQEAVDAFLESIH